KALFAYQNAHGGINGRRIKPVFWALKTVSSESFAQQEQEECSTWTQDHHVFAGMTYVYSTTILQCLQDAGAALVSVESSNTKATSPLHHQYPYYVEPITFDLDPGAAAMADGLYGMNYFAKNEKV